LTCGFQLATRTRRSVPVMTMSTAKIRRPRDEVEPPRVSSRLEGEGSDRILPRLLAIEKQLRLVEQPNAPRISRRRVLE
jgi:hypothetical protein